MFVPRNQIFGIRTTWSEYNDVTWKKSNKFLGILLIIVGIVSMITFFTISSDMAEIKAFINEVTDGRGVDISMECVGYPATFDVCQNVISVGGHIANVGVHGKPVSFNLDDLWIKNITLNTGLVNANTTEMLLNVLKSGKIDATKLITHHFKLSEVEKAYDVFKHAGENNALKVIIENDISE